MNGKRFSQEKARKNGFYLALAVCLVAVGVAAWSTYDAVNGVAEPANTDPTSSQLFQQQAEEVRSSQTVSAQPEEDQDPEEPASSAAPTPTPSPQTQETAGAVASQPEEGPESGEEQPPESEAAQPEQIPANGPLYAISTQLQYPVQSQEVMKAYSAGAPVYSDTMKDWRIHAGLDLAAQSGETVAACGNGMVLSTYTDPMLGNVVVVQHGDFDFSYCGLGENFQVAEGDIVTQGQAIGAVTAVPAESADEPHLHLEVQRDGVYLDPQAVLNGDF